MIFVCLGTQDKPFVRLIEMVETCIKEKAINDKVVVQAGYTQYHSDLMEIFDYIDMEAYTNFMETCDILITHGGVGTIVQGVKQNKTVIVIPREAQYGEHHNDHQLEITESFTEKGYILSARNVEELKAALLKAKTFRPQPFESNNANFINLIRQEIGS